ncbi:RING finger protein 17 [Bombina bombina]|uniref:RING finger protein 17 n=1 Tax=Bombina bombina TaxID=8345 RepID=UPI00235A8CCA|nr:RING finger protein 17 [Bombina bombina]
MYEVYHNSAPETVSWIRNMFVAVQLPVIKQWRRGQIKTIVTENLVEVLHYDFGIQEVTDVSNIRMLNDNMKTYGSLCLECALKDIRPAGGSTNWTATACDVLSFYLKGAVATMIIEENTAMWPLPVMISCKDEAGQLVDISDFLVKRGLALKERRVNKSETLMELKEVNKGSSSVIKSDDFSASEMIQEHKSVIKSDDFSASEMIQEHKSVIKSDDFSASEMIQEHKSVIKSDDFSASEMIQEHKSVIKSDDFSASEMIQEHKSVIKSDDFSASEMIQEHKSKFNNAAFVKNTEIMQPGSDEPMIDQSLEEPYLSPIIPDKDNFSAKVSCVGEEGIIYVIQKGLEENLNELMVDIQKSFKGLGLLAPYSWKKGEGCLIKGSDTMSYRGKVLEILGRDMIRVQYEDYGNIEKIPTCHLYPFVFNSHIPRFCIPCQLHDTVPIGDTWQSDTIQLLEELLMDRNVEIQVVEPPISSGSIMSVHIYCSNASVSDILKQHGHWIPEVCPCEREDISNLGSSLLSGRRGATEIYIFSDASTEANATVAYLKVTDIEEKPHEGFINNREKQRGKSQRKNCIDSGSNYFSKSILENNFESSFDGLLKQTFETPVLPRYTLPSLPNPGQLFAVSITHIQTPNEVYICMDPINKISIETDTDDSECSDLDEDILESKLKSVNITANSLPFLTDFRPDMPCLAKYAVDGQLYRAKLQSFINCDPVQFVVEFVDYGSTTILDTNSIYQLPESLIHYPQKAIKVKLAGFKPPLEDFEADRLPYCREWSMKALWAMKELLQEKQLFASCVTSFPDVSIRLYDKTKRLVHKPLISMGLADLDF